MGAAEVRQNLSPVDDRLIRQLHRSGASLVVLTAAGRTCEYRQAGVRDLEALLRQNPDILRGAAVADKVVGKAAAAMMIVGGVSEVYGEVMSRKAEPLLRRADIPYSYGRLVDRIVIPEGDRRCPLEQIVEPAATAGEAVTMLFDHFERMHRESHE